MKQWIWFFYYGIASAFLISGFFWMFSYYSKMPEYAKDALKIAIENQTPPVIQKPPFPYVSIFLVIAGSVIYLTTKFFYDKTQGGKNVKRTKKHG